MRETCVVYLKQSNDNNKWNNYIDGDWSGNNVRRNSGWLYDPSRVSQLIYGLLWPNLSKVMGLRSIEGRKNGQRLLVVILSDNWQGVGPTSLFFSLRWLRLVFPLPGVSDWWPGSPVVHAHHPISQWFGSCSSPQLLKPPQLLKLNQLRRWLDDFGPMRAKYWAVWALDCS